LLVLALFIVKAQDEFFKEWWKKQERNYYI
jgi:hypothetical protein